MSRLAWGAEDREQYADRADQSQQIDQMKLRECLAMSTAPFSQPASGDAGQDDEDADIGHQVGDVPFLF